MLNGALAVGDGGIDQRKKILCMSPASTKIDKMFASGFGVIRPFQRCEKFPSAPMPGYSKSWL